jgi:hypothetical protein
MTKPSLGKYQAEFISAAIHHRAATDPKIVNKNYAILPYGQTLRSAIQIRYIKYWRNLE